MEKSYKLMPMVYLACPYSNTTNREGMYEMATHCAPFLMELGFIVYSPITHSHPIDLEAQDWKINVPYEQWIAGCLNILDICDLIVVMYPYVPSKGVALELLARKDSTKVCIMMLDEKKNLILRELTEEAIEEIIINGSKPILENYSVTYGYAVYPEEYKVNEKIKIN
jgi:hypothetical protein